MVSQSPHFAGAALKALASGQTIAPFTFPEPPSAEKGRDRIWDLSPNLHCSIVGTCLTTADARHLLAKLGEHDARTMSEHRLHGQIVHMAGRRDGGGKLLQKALDRRHEREIKRFAGAVTQADVRALWRESLDRGEIPGAYWAAITHPATDWALVQDIFGEVHMLSHLVGQSNRADIRRLRQHEIDLAEQDETISRQERRITALMEERDALSDRNRAIEAVQGRISAAGPIRDQVCDRDATRTLEMRLTRERAHAEALDEKIATLMMASGRLSVALELEIAGRRAAEAEVAALERVVSAQASGTEIAATGTGDTLRRRTILYVGGRPRQVANLRRFTESREGWFLSHDGGVEESVGLLAGLIGQSDLVVFPVDCVSHEATILVKRFCQDTATPFRPVRSASLASFIQAIAPSPDTVGD
ncbi:DUF2325 domain-containing protein [Methylobacterium sp. BTF04]|uniref:DUF2325 domain-containing protein n=1 Tax=Methylobacterium sp. BTF04 TaxID=2708300 RepID=UPI0013D652B6|nr:DUF2325 domain-containing protein [Methylobacterium sp. BTF04]NEU14884.1 DUF2325 domain-containing protein [Methylobacterium sp. BTF04]